MVCSQFVKQSSFTHSVWNLLGSQRVSFIKYALINGLTEWKQKRLGWNGGGQLLPRLCQVKISQVEIGLRHHELQYIVFVFCFLVAVAIHFLTWMSSLVPRKQPLHMQREMVSWWHWGWGTTHNRLSQRRFFEPIASEICTCIHNRSFFYLTFSLKYKYGIF